MPDKRSAVFAAPIIMILHVFYVGKFCQKENIMHENLDLYESQMGRFLRETKTVQSGLVDSEPVIPAAWGAELKMTSVGPV